MTADWAAAAYTGAAALAFSATSAAASLRRSRDPDEATTSDDDNDSEDANASDARAAAADWRSLTAARAACSAKGLPVGGEAALTSCCEGSTAVDESLVSAEGLDGGGGGGDGNEDEDENEEHRKEAAVAGAIEDDAMARRLAKGLAAMRRASRLKSRLVAAAFNAVDMEVHRGFNTPIALPLNSPTSSKPPVRA